MGSAFPRTKPNSPLFKVIKELLVGKLVVDSGRELINLGHDRRSLKV
jgi:hypothetical protein